MKADTVAKGIYSKDNVDDQFNEMISDFALLEGRL